MASAGDGDSGRGSGRPTPHRRTYRDTESTKQKSHQKVLKKGDTVPEVANALLRAAIENDALNCICAHLCQCNSMRLYGPCK